ncbi:hypothetical protein GQX73_g5830 [Xylaria multiplex]|uniref:ATP-grasp domain-containing protein n=1 Tax=Xylaria multiplex TaxID=323545 RepID=A0A7C8ML85_9PEZI|nr:hypothetical protein GQX73_g5830 [Xylaria multiplex]
MSDMRSTTLWARTEDAREFGAECRWSTSRTVTPHSSPGTPVQTIDVIFSAKPGISRPLGVDISGPCVALLKTDQHETCVLTSETLAQESAFRFLHECLAKTPQTGTATARFVIPLQRGTIIMSDIVSYRLRDAFRVESTASFAAPLQVFPGLPLALDTISLPDIFHASAGAALLNPNVCPESATGRLPPEIESDFKDKLSIPWISTTPISRKRLVLVGSSNQDPEGGGWTQFARRAAVALGIDLVFIDKEDGWLARGNYGSWYETLLPTPASWWAEPSVDELVKLVEGRPFGLNSEGVTRVDDASELEDAISAARKSGRSRSEVGDRVLVERYCEGPEVDVNMVFVDGEVLFSEICDDFPKGADVGDGATDTKAVAPDHRRNFQETNMVFPSALPEDELQALQDAVKNTLQSLGFRNGVMHVEARIAQSKRSYQSVDGVVDLRERGVAEDTPTPWIIEVNPRPPGLFASQTPGSVYGIDYWGVSLLLRVGDQARAAALCQPFANGAQSHTVLVMIRAEFDRSCEGIFDSDDVCAELLERHPDLKEHLGRQEALVIARKVREEIRYDIR